MSGSESYRPTVEQLLRQRALLTAQEVARSAGVDSDLWEMRVRGITSWVYADGQPSDPWSSTVAVKLIRDRAPDDLYMRMTQEVDMLQSLGQVGAPVPRFLVPPVIKDGFVAIVTEYLPISIEYTHQDLYDYGMALAKLHNAGEQRQDIVAKALPFDPLADVRNLYDSMAEYRQEARISPEFIEEVYLPRLREGEVAVQEILAFMMQKGRREVIVQPDVTRHNARRDRNGQVVLIDLDQLMRGPAEFTLGRPLGQWQENFGCPAEWTQSVREGYEVAANSPLDSDILTRALLVSKIKFATSPLDQLINALKQGCRPDGWAVQESTRRLATIGSSDCRWFSQEAYLKMQGRT